VLKRASGRPYIFHVADPWPDFPIQLGAIRRPQAVAAARSIERAAYQGAALVTTVSERLVARLDSNPAARGRVRLLRNGVDITRFDPNADRSAARRDLGWPQDRFTIAYVGNLGVAQGVHTLIDAVEGLTDVDLRLVGDGPDREELVTRAARVTNVTIAPSLPSGRVPTVLAAADGLAVLLRRGPLSDESLPTKLVEALASGRPVIVSADGIAAEVVGRGRAGCIAPAEDVAALREAIVRCRSADRHAMGMAGRALAEREFDRAAIVDRLESYLFEAERSSSR
jgi:glycosyltransferase involved in cell wall biosynthesis